MGYNESRNYIPFMKGLQSMKLFEDFLSKISQVEQRARTEEVLSWVMNKYPKLVPEIKWNQPMFTDHGTFILALSVAKQHLSIAPEWAGLLQFNEELIQAGYNPTHMLFRIKWNQAVDYELLSKIIDFNITDKANCQTFWR